MGSKKQFRLAAQGDTNTPVSGAVTAEVCKFYSGVFRAFCGLNPLVKPSDYNIT